MPLRYAIPVSFRSLPWEWYAVDLLLIVASTVIILYIDCQRPLGFNILYVKRTPTPSAHIGARGIDRRRAGYM